MNFVSAIRNTKDVAGYLQNGLQALKKDSAKISVPSPRGLEGSVNIDECLKKKYPEEPRWDYVLGYQGRVYYVEVHPASTSEVEAVIAKLRWLKGWRKTTALETLATQSTYHWIASGDVHITRHSKYERLLAENGLCMPQSRLSLEK